MKRWIITALVAAGLFGGGYGVAQVKDKPINKPVDVPEVTTSGTAKVETTQPTTKEDPAPVPKGDGKPTISKAEFEQIKLGMTYEQVTQIIGSPEKVIQEKEPRALKTMLLNIHGKEKIKVQVRISTFSSKI